MNENEQALSQLQQGIISYIDAKIDKMPFDITKSGVITKVNKNGTYEVSINGVKYDKIKSIGGECKLNEAVNILIKQNNYNTMVILKSAKKNDEPEPVEFDITPEWVYSQRPTDWVKMPTPDDNEIYMLMFILDGYDDTLAFKCDLENTSSSYTTSVGYMDGDNFVDIRTFQTQSGQWFNQVITPNGDYPLTEDNKYRQVMIKVKSNSNITTFTRSNINETIVVGQQAWNYIKYFNIYEISAKFVKCNRIDLSYCKNLQYLNLLGNNQYHQLYLSQCVSLKTLLNLDLSNMLPITTQPLIDFQFCTNLIVVPDLVLKPNLSIADNYCMIKFTYCSSLLKSPKIENSKIFTSTASMFEFCRSLKIVQLFDTSTSQNNSSMFANCESLKTIPEFDFSNGAVYRLFFNCYSLENISQIKLGTNYTIYQQQDKQQVFAYCTALKYVNLHFNNTSSKTDIGSNSGMFTSCCSLNEVRISYEYNRIKMSSMMEINGSMSVKALRQLFNDLPIIDSTSTSKVLRVSGNRGWSQLTTSDKLIATSKGWTVN